jgi:hypothetical protein
MHGHMNVKIPSKLFVIPVSLSSWVILAHNLVDFISWLCVLLTDYGR